MNELSTSNRRLFEELKEYFNGVECWDARKLMPHVGYANWRDFHNAIQRAIEACRTNGEVVENQFLRVSAKTSSQGGRPGANYKLTRRACYYVFQNGDSRIPGIAAAMAYFVQQAIRQERLEKFQVGDHDVKRVTLWDDLDDGNERLLEVATGTHKVTDTDSFDQAGKRGLYGNRAVEEVERDKNIPPGSLLNRAGPTELAAHYFRVTQTEDVLSNEAKSGNIYGQEGAEDIHESIGMRVRQTMRDNGATPPEELPAEIDIQFARERIEQRKERVQKQIKSADRKPRQQSDGQLSLGESA